MHIPNNTETQLDKGTLRLMGLQCMELMLLPTFLARVVSEDQRGISETDALSSHLTTGWLLYKAMPKESAVHVPPIPPPLF